MVKANTTYEAGVSLHHLALQYWLETERHRHTYDADSDPMFGSFIRAQPNQQRFRFLRAWLAANWGECGLASAAQLTASLDKGKVVRKLSGCDFDTISETVARVQSAHRDLAGATRAWKELLGDTGATTVPPLPDGPVRPGDSGPTQQAGAAHGGTGSGADAQATSARGASRGRGHSTRTPAGAADAEETVK
jgi:hypothetical protein